MKRKDNSTLKGASVFFQNFETVGVGASAGEMIGLAVRRSVGDRARFFLDGGLDDYSREFFNWPVREKIAVLKSYVHGSRTAVYSVGNDREVTLTLGRNWADYDTFDNFERQYKAANASFRFHFGFDFLSSPTLTGMYGLESCLPYKLPYSVPSDEFRELLHSQTTQGRSEMFDSHLPERFFYFDRRFAYAADAKLELPCGEPLHKSGEGCEFVPYETAFYRVAFRVPGGWEHVGLLPVLGDGWSWPRASRYYETFVATPELQLAAEFGWRFEVIEKWSFQSFRPMEKFVKTLESLWFDAKKEHQTIEADIYRRIVLQAIGGLYARSFERERFVGLVELVESNDESVLNAELVEGGAMVTERRERRDERFYMPEWTAFIWSRARARLNKALLSLPYRSLIGCHVDAVYSDSDLARFAPGLVGERVGQFRLKGQLSGSQRIESKADLSKVRALSEAGMADRAQLKGGE